VKLRSFTLLLYAVKDFISKPAGKPPEKGSLTFKKMLGGVLKFIFITYSWLAAERNWKLEKPCVYDEMAEFLISFVSHNQQRCSQGLG